MLNKYEQNTPRGKITINKKNTVHITEKTYNPSGSWIYRDKKYVIYIKLSAIISGIRSLKYDTLQFWVHSYFKLPGKADTVTYRHRKWPATISWARQRQRQMDRGLLMWYIIHIVIVPCHCRGIDWLKGTLLYCRTTAAIKIASSIHCCFNPPPFSPPSMILFNHSDTGNISNFAP